MDDGRFRVLLHMLKAMRESASPKLENTIISIIDTFKEAMTDEQQREALAEFARYESLRKDMERHGKLSELLEDEKYRELVRRQPFNEETDLGE